MKKLIAITNRSTSVFALICSLSSLGQGAAAAAASHSARSAPAAWRCCSAAAALRRDAASAATSPARADQLSALGVAVPPYMM